MLTELIFVPAFIMIAGAIILAVLPQVFRSAFFLFVTAAALASVWAVPEGAALTASVMNFDLILFEIDQLSRGFVTIFAIAAFAGGIYAFHIKETGQQVSALLYAGSAMGVTCAGDYFTLFIFWEIMAVASAYLVWAARTRESEAAGMRYLLFHLLGGGLLLAGILLHLNAGGSLYIEKLFPGTEIASLFMLSGVFVNVAMPPLHAWLSDAYPKASITGAVFLSAFTTKTAVYVLIRIFPGWEILIPLGMMMAFYGIIYAIITNDMRSILAYHIISQLGFMVIAVGIGTELSLNAAAAHAFSNIINKSLLFMGAGAILYTTGTAKLSDLGGLYPKLKTVFILYMVGALSISGAPLFAGFMTKGMVLKACSSDQLYIYMILLMLTTVGTFLSVGLKLPFFAWFSEKKEISTVKLPVNMIAGMGFLAFFALLYGLSYAALQLKLPYEMSYNPYTAHQLFEVSQILIFAFIAFWIMRKLLKPKPYITIDLDWFYRKPANIFRAVFIHFVNNFFDRAQDLSYVAARKLALMSKNPVRYFVRDESDDLTYSADRYRPDTQTIMFWILLSFVLIALAGILLIR